MVESDKVEPNYFLCLNPCTSLTKFSNICLMSVDSGVVTAAETRENKGAGMKQNYSII
jgi:hypothetical protein